MTKENPEQSVIINSLRLIAESGTAMEMPRSHNKHLGNTFDTVASHQNHASIIAYVIARLEGHTHEDGIRAMAMMAIHDLAEVRTGDLDYVAKHYGSNDENKAVKDMLKGLPFGDDLQSLHNEYEERETDISKCAKDADAIEQLFQEWVLMYRGNKLAEKWFNGDLVNRLPYLRTESAKRLAQAMSENSPDLWWWQELVDDNLNHTHLNGKK